MDIEVLRSFTEIIESGSITAAAKKLYVTQAALSTQLKTLEKELDTVLLIRSAHRLELTEAGKVLYKRAKSITAIENSLKKEIRDRSRGINGSLRIGVSAAEGYGICGGTVDDFLALHPNVRCEIYEGEDTEILAMADSGALGAAFLRTPCTVSGDMQIISLAPEPMAAVYSPTGHVLLGEGSISLKQLSGLRIALQRRYEGLITATFLKAAKKKELEPSEIIFSAYSTSAVGAFAEKGSAVGIIPKSAAKLCKGLLSCDIEDGELFTERIIAAGRKSGLTGAEKMFLDGLA